MHNGQNIDANGGGKFKRPPPPPLPAAPPHQKSQIKNNGRVDMPAMISQNVPQVIITSFCPSSYANGTLISLLLHRRRIFFRQPHNQFKRIRTHLTPLASFFSNSINKHIFQEKVQLMQGPIFYSKFNWVQNWKKLILPLTTSSPSQLIHPLCATTWWAKYGREQILSMLVSSNKNVIKFYNTRLIKSMSKTENRLQICKTFPELLVICYFPINDGGRFFLELQFKL